MVLARHRPVLPLLCTMGVLQRECCFGLQRIAAAAAAAADPASPVTSSLEQLLPSVLKRNRLLFCGQLAELLQANEVTGRWERYRRAWMQVHLRR
jgi:hypothetical protein